MKYITVVGKHWPRQRSLLHAAAVPDDMTEWDMLHGDHHPVCRSTMTMKAYDTPDLPVLAQTKPWDDASVADKCLQCIPKVQKLIEEAAA